jgi:hypothetical protein
MRRRTSKASDEEMTSSRYTAWMHLCACDGTCVPDDIVVADVWLFAAFLSLFRLTEDLNVANAELKVLRRAKLKLLLEAEQQQ